MQKQISHTDQSRRQKVSEHSSNEKTEKNTQIVSTDKVKNPNATKAVTAIWYQMVEQYTSLLTLESVDVEFMNAPANPAALGAAGNSFRKQRRVRLSEVDSLLSEVVDPAKIADVKNAIKSQLESVLDYQDQPTSIVEEVPKGTDKTILRFKKNLQTDYVVKDGNGNPLQTIHVDGLLLKVFTNVLASGQLTLDLVVGASDAVAG